ncbi:peptidoglycan-binding protein [Streptomycetaceae bacterium NBC_01309]
MPGVQSWVFRQAGAAGPAPVTVSCAAGVAWFRSRGRFSEYPAVGAQVFFGPGGGSHVGLVYAYDAAYAYTVEGNTNATGSAEGDGVHLKKRLRRDAYVYGYGHPAYPGGIVSAAPGAVPAPPPFPGAGAFRLNASHPAVVDLDRRLIAKGRARHHDGNGYQPGPVFTEYTRRNVRDFQLAQGWSGADADGYPGPETWRRLWT